MRISIVTLFPSMFAGPFDLSILKRAQAEKLVQINFFNVRDFATDHYKSVDGHPYGGGAGMILRVDVVDAAITHIRRMYTSKSTITILLDPQGKTYTQSKAQQLTAIEHLILVCGHYEGIDERIRTLVDEEISIGDYILTGGEIPAMVLVDTIVRLLPGVLHKESATKNESFSDNLLEYPQYTKPHVYNSLPVPPVLMGGNHKKIAEWNTHQALIRTKKRRSDLLKVTS